MVGTACSVPEILAITHTERDWHFTAFSRIARSSEDSNNQLYLRDWIRKLDCIRSDFNNSSLLYCFTRWGLIEKAHLSIFLSLKIQI